MKLKNEKKEIYFKRLSLRSRNYAYFVLVENTTVNRIRQDTDQNPTFYGLVNAMSYLGNSPWREPPGGDFRGNKGRPPDIWNSIFIYNLVSSKLDILGNVVVAGGDLL